MNDCLFCKIIAGEIPSGKIYENDVVYAFLDITPNNPGHTLVIPKTHYKNIFELPEEILCEMTKVVKKLSIVIKSALNADGINLAMNNEKHAGQVIFHSHIHIIPRHKEDGFTHWKGTSYEDGKMEEVAEKIKKEL